MGLNFIFILKAIVIAIVEGLTEFVPVSSTGHMILVGDLIGFHGTEFTNMFEVVIQLGAILAVIVLYWNKLWGLLCSFCKWIVSPIARLIKGKNYSLSSKDKKGVKLSLAIIIGCIPAAILGLSLDDLIDKYLFSTKTVAIGFIVGGILLLIVENNFRSRAKRSKTTKTVDDISYGQALKVGIFQCLSLWPGMSRSASTIMGGWIAGISTTAAAEYSFFLAIPVMFGASGLKIYKYKGFATMTSTEWVSLIVGFIVAFIVSILVIDGFISYLKKKPMRIFALYRIVAGIILALLILIGVIS
ncbi:undecaprenyl-diphosphate phosphatase [Clostridium fallax]|uniref:Undecaprenyl-diphosphatase n=1 Tax=Clostridium fallax TaxID=1533 RepID=A0A1M4WV45_9CLOT|nr:undecaprenyl-diphosphate phosphatase [Clostridium fallax]SHE85037.1 Undecaprenyl-diphosphatase [Clostridium fallax]SQB07420.1 undecaprenyl pyrophosphate phosphatase [Clostridium fallax]